MLASIVGWFVPIWKYRMLILAAVAVAYVGVLHLKIWHYKDEMNDLIDEKNRAILVATEAVVKVTRTQIAITEKLEHEHDKEIATLRQRNDAALTSLLGKASNGNLPGLSGTSGVHNERTLADRFSETDARAFIELARDAEENTLRLLACQTWIEEQRNVWGK
jgi:hypothetical protein